MRWEKEFSQNIGNWVRLQTVLAHIDEITPDNLNGVIKASSGHLEVQRHGDNRLYIKCVPKESKNNKWWDEASAETWNESKARKNKKWWEVESAEAGQVVADAAAETAEAAAKPAEAAPQPAGSAASAEAGTEPTEAAAEPVKAAAEPEEAAAESAEAEPGGDGKHIAEPAVPEQGSTKHSSAQALATEPQAAGQSSTEVQALATPMPCTTA